MIPIGTANINPITEKANARIARMAASSIHSVSTSFRRSLDNLRSAFDTGAASCGQIPEMCTSCPEKDGPNAELDVYSFMTPRGTH